MMPVTMFLRIVGIMSVVEALVMGVFWFIYIPQGIITAVIDAVLLATISTPFIYLWIINPVQQNLLARTNVIEYESTHDQLTGLPNRFLLQDRLQQAILAAQRENKPVALLVIDLNRFKEVNNNLTHFIGDLLLKQIGPRIRGVLRESDTLARLEGDKFAVILPLTNLEDTTLVVHKILKALEQPFILEGLALNVDVSIGIAYHPNHGKDANVIIQRADIAMYVAKQASDPYFVYAANQDQYDPQRLTLMGELRSAIDRDQLFLVYQPKVELKTGRVSGVEALVRWQHPQRGVIPPDQFILLAEQTGLIKPLTLWVLQGSPSPVPCLAPRGYPDQCCCEPVGAKPAGSAPPGPNRGAASVFQSNTEVFGAGDHREHYHGGPGTGYGGPYPPEQDGDAAFHRRLRNRLFLPELSQKTPRGGHQD